MEVYNHNLNTGGIADSFQILPARKDRVTLIVTAGREGIAEPLRNSFIFAGPPGQGQEFLVVNAFLTGIFSFSKRFLREDYHEILDRECWWVQRGPGNIAVVLTEVICTCGLPVY